MSRRSRSFFLLPLLLALGCESTASLIGEPSTADGGTADAREVGADAAADTSPETLPTGAPCHTDADCAGCTGPGECAVCSLDSECCYGGGYGLGCWFIGCFDARGDGNRRCRMLPKPTG